MTQTQNVLSQIEEIKARLISIETIFIKSERATKEDRKAVKEAMEEYKKGKTVSYKF